MGNKIALSIRKGLFLCFLYGGEDKFYKDFDFKEDFKMKYLKIFMPMFAADGGGAGGSGGEGTAGTGTGEGEVNNSTGTGEGTGEGEGQKEGKDKLPDDFDRLLQARLDKAMAEERKKNASLTKEIEKMKREKMTADELKKYDDEKRDRELAEREQAVVDKENRYYAISAIKKAGLDDGGDTALKIVDLVLGKDSTEIDSKVTALNELVNKLVDSKVDEKFRSAGRIPNTGNSSNNTEDKKGADIAKKLGKERAELNKKSNDILKYYI